MESVMSLYVPYKRSLRFDPKAKEPYKLSRTRIDNFFKCPRCFWLEERYKVKRPDSYPLTLNIAVDALLKKEFDIYRAKKVAHPLMKSYGVNAIPFAHPHLDTWRQNFTGIRYLHESTNFLLFGAVDDVWVTPKGELLVVDYKATAKANSPTLEGALGAQYKRQMEVYQWLLRQNRFLVSNTGYFVYVNGKKDAKAFDGKLEFDVLLLPSEGDASWMEPTLVAIKSCLMNDSVPKPNSTCEYCLYRASAQEALQKTLGEKSPSRKKIHEENTDTSKLF